jgi:hypothetical protein
MLVMMSLSAGITRAARAPDATEGTSELTFTVITDSITSSVADFNLGQWFTDEAPPELAAAYQEPMRTSGRSAPSISYSPNTFSLTQGTAMNTVTPSVTGSVTSWSISPSLPSGLSLSSSTGAISGTPTALSSQTAYTVNASNSNGYDTATVTITVNEPLPVIVYSPNTFTLSVGTAMTAVSPTIYAGTVDSYSISPSLPSGLSLNTANGTVSGTPTAVATSASYTVTATNTAGTDTATLTIVVNDVAPTSITYNPSSFTLTKGTTMNTTTPTTTGGTVTTWAVSPSLPAGLSIASSDGASQRNANDRYISSNVHLLRVRTPVEVLQQPSRLKSMMFRPSSVIHPSLH